MQMALGAQFRMQTEEVKLDDYSNRAINPCPTLGVTNCFANAAIGPLALARPANVNGAAATNFTTDFRRFPVAAVFLELQAPILDSLEWTLAGREEKFYSDVTDRDNKVFVPQTGLKWQPLDWLGMRGSWGKTFSQVNPPRNNPPILATTTLNDARFGIGAAPNTYTTANYPNLDVQPEKGKYWDVGFLFRAGNFTSNIDYYNININDYTRTMTVAQLLQAVAVPGQTGSAAHINCASDLLTKGVASLGGKPFVELNGGNANCTANSTFGPTGVGNMAGGNINYFAAVNQTNSGRLDTSGVDFSTSYRFDDVIGGSFTAAIDASYIIKWQLGDFTIAGVKVADGYDGVGYLNSATGKLGIPVEKYRGTLTLTYRHDIHTVNLVTTYLPSLINDSSTDFLVSAVTNANVGGANGATPASAACGAIPTPGSAAANTPQTPGSVNNLGSITPGAGTGASGTGTILNPGAIALLNSNLIGYCYNQNSLVNSGRTLDAYYNVDLIYRVQLPDELGLTLTVDNVTNHTPPFFRGIVSYNTAYGSPLMRNYKLGITKRF
jgi:outer membrane receptor protein involved in Fe transport